MQTSNSTPNQRLRELVQASGLADAVAMTIFNRGLGAAACSVSQWKGFLAEPASAAYQPLPAELLANAEAQFSKLSAPAAATQASPGDATTS